MDTSKTNHVCLQLQNKMNLRKINISKYKKNDKIKKNHKFSPDLCNFDSFRKEATTVTNMNGSVRYSDEFQEEKIQAHWLMSKFR